jgi:hypothetical protein
VQSIDRAPLLKGLEKMKHYLSFGNAKLKKSNIYTFGIPAGSTCPGKGTCAIGCYAQAGFFNMPVVKNAQQSRLELTKHHAFIETLSAEIKKRKVKTLRIHDSGDFYSLKYLNQWLEIIQANPQVNFYAYTKMVPFFQGRMLPKNFKVIFSYGGKFDHLIKPLAESHSKVFGSLSELKKHGYANASHDDTVAIKQQKIGLIFHGPKSRKWVTQ